MPGSSVRNKKIKINESTRQMANIFNDFLVATSLHGYGYLHSVNSMALKVIWALVIVMMTGLGVMFVAINTQKYFEARIITNIESSTANLSVSEFKFLISLTARGPFKSSIFPLKDIIFGKFPILQKLNIFRKLFGPLSQCAT